MDSFNKMVRKYIQTLGLYDKIALHDFVWLSIKDDLIALHDFVWLSIKDDLRKCKKETK